MWNKACEELRKHQELCDKMKQRPDFLTDPYGNPFSSDEIEFSGGELSSDNDEDLPTMDEMYLPEEQGPFPRSKIERKKRERKVYKIH